MKSSPSLRGRLILSHLTVVLVATVVLVVASRVLAESFFRGHLHDMAGMMGGEEMMNGPMMQGDLGVTLSDIEANFRNSLTSALGLAILAGIVTAIGAAIVASMRIVKPIATVRDATRRLAAGHYSERVPTPHTTELAALAEDVNRLAASLEATEQRRLELISEVAHELRTPVATIRGYMEGLLDGVFEQTAEIFAAVSREASRLERLTADLSELSRTEEGAVSLERREVNLAALVGDLVERWRPRFEGESLNLSFETASSPTVVGDPDRLSQVITNLLSNAVRYTQTGGTVTIRVTGSADEAHVTVTDDGRGLTADELDHVFERFYRADPSVPGGAGIGLTIARDLARLHDGDLTASSPGPGLGATFTLTLPLADAATRPPARSRRPEDAP